MKKADVAAKGGDVSKVRLIEIPTAPLATDRLAKGGSFDNGDNSTSNLYVGNLSPDMDESLMCR